MMKNVEIIAQAFNPVTGAPLGKPRCEVTNIKKNALYNGCNTLTDCAEAYMTFWNRLPSVQKEMVLVQSIRWL